MANLADQIKRNSQLVKRGSQLFEAAPESLFSQVQRQGLAPGAAVSPQAAAGMGVTADQAKMAGSAAQVQKAVRESLQPARQLGAVQTRITASASEQAAKQKAGQLAGLEALGTRVSGVVNQVIQSSMKDASIDADKLQKDFSGLTPQQLAQVKDAIFNNKVDSPEIASMLGVTVDQLPQLFAKYNKQVVTPSFNQTKFDSDIAAFETRLGRFLTEAEKTSLKKALEDAIAGKAIDLATLSKKFDGKEAFFTKVTGPEIASAIAAYKQAGEANIASSIGAAVGNDVTLGQLASVDPNTGRPYIESLGFSNLGDLAKLLGEDDLTQFSALTIDQLQQRIDSIMNQDFDRVEELSSIANDPFYPANVRAAAQAQLKDLSSVGVQATEADMNRLNDAIQAADTIVIGTKSYTVAELLADEQLSGVIKLYLEDTEGKYKTALKQQFPALVDFIEQNRTALKKASESLATESTVIADVVKSNTELDSYDTVDLSGFNAIAIPGYKKGEIVNTKYPKTEAHNILALPEEQFSSENKLLYAKFLNELAQLDDTIVKEFAGYDLNELIAEKQRISPRGSWNDFFKGYSSYLKSRNLANSAATDEVVLVANLGEDTATIAQDLKDYYQLGQYGIGDIANLSTELKQIYQLLDGGVGGTPDGKMDSPAEIRARIKQYYGGPVDPTRKSLKQLLTDARAELEVRKTDSLYQVLADNNISMEEADQATKGMDNAKIINLYNLINEGKYNLKADAGVIEKLQDKIKSTAKREAELLGINPDKLIADGLRPIEAGYNAVSEFAPVSQVYTYDEWVNTGNSPSTYNRTSIDLGKKRYVVGQYNRINKQIEEVTKLLSANTNALQQDVYKQILATLNQQKQFLLANGASFIPASMSGIVAAAAPSASSSSSAKVASTGGGGGKSRGGSKGTRSLA